MWKSAYRKSPGVVKVPNEAVLHSGERNVVIVEKEKGLFDPREVVTRSQARDTQIIRGLRAGETIVTSSQFLIDSESNLKEAIRKYSQPDGGKQEPDNPELPRNTRLIPERDRCSQKSSNGRSTISSWSC